MARMDDGLPKLWLIARTLGVRRAHPEWFGAQADYESLTAAGVYADHVVAFVRGGSVVTLVPRLFVGLPGDPDSVTKAWGSTSILLPPGNWRNHLDPPRTFAGKTKIAELLRVFPVALLSKE